MSNPTNSTTILFMCPHSAGKSLAAATYFRAAATRLGADVTINVAGPDPDDVNMPNVVAALSSQGHEIGWNPKLVSASDTEQADILVSIGCELDAIPTDKPVTEWDVPMISQDLDASLQAIHAKAESLAADLAAK